MQNNKLMQMQIGEQYSAQKIIPNETWITLGGYKSKPFQPKIGILNPNFEQIHPISSFSSKYVSYDLANISHNMNISDDKVNIQLSSQIPIITLDNLQSLPKKGLNIEFGLETNIKSRIFTNHQEGWIHHHIIEFMNEIQGVEYISYNYFPTLRLHRELISHGDLSEAINQIGDYLIKRLKETFSEIDQIQIDITVGIENILHIRDKIEEKLFKRRESLFSSHSTKEISNQNMQNFYAFTFDQSIAIYNAIILTPNSSDPAGYLNYEDFTDTVFAPQLKKKYMIKKYPLGNVIDQQTGEYSGLNQYFRELSFESIQKVELLGSQNPLPVSQNSELLLFPIPNHNGLGVMDGTFRKKLLKKITYKNLKTDFCDGHQHKQFIACNFAQLISYYKSHNSSISNKIGWINHSLVERMKGQIDHPMLAKIATERDALSYADYIAFITKKGYPLTEILSQKRDKTSGFEPLLENYANLETEVSSKLTKPIHLKEVQLTILSPNGEEYEVDISNFKLTADSMAIRKKKS
jgi:CO dehydrogenase/acetyl-CoA synthase beta subunit